jgi:hypothetical protein
MRNATALACLILALAASQASAATTVGVGDEFPGAPVEPSVVIRDESGDVNSLTISYTYTTNGEPFPPPGNAVVTVQDASAPLEPGAGCAATAEATVRCEVDGIFAIRAHLGGGADRATAASPPAGTLSCDCVRVFGGDGADQLTSFDGAILDGEGADDLLTGRPSQAGGIRGGLGGPSDDTLVGGDGDDLLYGANGDDGMSGGAGDDILRGGTGNDFLSGGGAPPVNGSAPAAGRDDLDAGEGDDTLDDSDDNGPEIGPDELAGGIGVDTIHSYMERSVGVRVDLSRPGGQGQPGEDDTLVNVENVYGGSGDDVLAGDGDANQLYGFGGTNRLRGRGGKDVLSASGAARDRLSGDRGDDFIDIQAWSRATIECGRGRDRVQQPFRGADSPRQPIDADPGAVIAASCEAVVNGAGASWGLDPVPDDPVSGRSLSFSRPRGFRYRKVFFLVVTRADRPFTELGKGGSRLHGVRVRLPERVARRARQRGMALRAELWDASGGAPRLRMIWRFRVKPAR